MQQTLRPPRKTNPVRILIAQTAWLGGSVRWHNGRLGWEHQGALVFPDAHDMARAQRHLFTIRRSPRLAMALVGEVGPWLAAQQERLAQVKRLHTLRAAHIPTALEQGRRSQQGRVQLVALLEAEACSLTVPPVSVVPQVRQPGAALLLRAIVQDATCPQPARALAALLLGAHMPPASTDAVWARRAWQHSAIFGVPAVPQLAVRLLRERDGGALVVRCDAALATADTPTIEMLLALLASGHPAATVVALAESLVAALQTGRAITRRAEPFPMRKRHLPLYTRRRAIHRASLREEYDVLMRQIARRTVLPAAVQDAAALFVHLHTIAPRADDLLAVLAVFRHVLAHPDTDLPPLLGLLARCADTFWPALPARHTASRWIKDRWQGFAEPALNLLVMVGDASLAADAVRLQAQWQLARFNWPDAAGLRLALRLMEDVPLPAYMLSLHNLPALLNGRRTTRPAMYQLHQTLLRLPAGQRTHAAGEWLAALPHTGDDLPALLPWLVRVLPKLQLLHTADDDGWCVCSGVVAGAVALFRADPLVAEVWLDWAIAAIRATGARSWGHARAIELGMPLAVLLADGSFATFQRLFTAMLRHPLDAAIAPLQRGVALLPELPGLALVLRRVLPTAPRRCYVLLARIGRLRDRAPDTRAPLHELANWFGAAGVGTAAPIGWQPLLDARPDLRPEVAAYLHARWLLGVDAGVPAGVQHALDLPVRLQTELAYLCPLVEARPSLAGRVATLQVRLADGERVRTQALALAAERLAALTDAALLEAAEQQVLACLRQRLREVAGPAAAHVALDDDLINAALLTMYIDENRRLLRRLLHAAITGDTDWRERHPLNRAFLDAQAARGVDVVAWLGANPRRFACATIPGGTVRLYLEQRPLRILQMGNLFDTCLSLDGVNAFSTVANACELNKRVIYAEDAHGRIVGRQLIAINDAGELVGFHIYSTLPDDQTSGLRAMFRRYVAWFASQCRLSLGAGEHVARLFAQAWYDDGVTSWEEDA